VLQIIKRAAETGTGPTNPELQQIRRDIAKLEQKEEQLVQNATDRIRVTEEDLGQLSRTGEERGCPAGRIALVEPTQWSGRSHAAVGCRGL